MADVTDNPILTCEGCGKTSEETRIFVLNIAGTDAHSVKWCESCMELNGFAKNPVA